MYYEQPYIVPCCVSLTRGRSYWLLYTQYWVFKHPIVGFNTPASDAWSSIFTPRSPSTRHSSFLSTAPEPVDNTDTTVSTLHTPHILLFVWLIFSPSNNIPPFTVQPGAEPRQADRKTCVTTPLTRPPHSFFLEDVCT